jgi:dTDP-4-dehydrorhamnose 3,5-epimerase
VDKVLGSLSLVATSLADVFIAALPTYRDHRGSLTVLGHESWVDFSAVQWNLSVSGPNVMRGLHAHKTHSDWLVSVTGNLRVGLFDLRPKSSTFGLSAVLTLGKLDAVLIPIGVGHGFFSLAPSTHVYSTSRPWSPDDEFGCRYDDPELKIDWQLANEPVLSERDENAGSLRQLLHEFSGWTEVKPREWPAQPAKPVAN